MDLYQRWIDASQPIYSNQLNMLTDILIILRYGRA